MTDSKRDNDLNADELDSQWGEELPEREVMSLVDAQVAATTNAAAALNVLSDDSTAVSNAEQTSEVE